jgi:hypothetical protein
MRAAHLVTPVGLGLLVAEAVATVEPLAVRKDIGLGTHASGSAV